MSIYMKADGITGNVTDSQYKDMIRVNDFHFGGVSNHAKTVVGRDESRINSRPSFGAIWISKPSDTSSINLFQAVHNGESIKFVEFYFVSSGNPNFTYEKIKLSNVIFSHFSLEHDSESQAPIEFMSLDYTDIERTYIPRDKENNIGNPRTSGYSLIKASSL
jgi:type VI secretion system secreted protein Hcp